MEICGQKDLQRIQQEIPPEAEWKENKNLWSTIKGLTDYIGQMDKLLKAQPFGKIAAMLPRDSASFVYLPSVPDGWPNVVKYIECCVAVGGAGDQNNEMGLFLTAEAPNDEEQELVPIWVVDVLDDFTAPGIKRNIYPADCIIPKDGYLWAGIRSDMSIMQPIFEGLHVLEAKVLVAYGIKTLKGKLIGTPLKDFGDLIVPNLRVSLD